MANKTIPAIQTNEGNVGIGTIAPSGKLSVDFAGVSAFNVCDSFSSNVRVTVGTVNTAGFTYGLIQTYQHNSDTAGVSPLNIQPFGGNIGIGRTNPTYKLDLSLGTISTNTNSFGYNVSGDATSNVGFCGYNFQLNNSTANASAYMRLARTSATVYLGLEIASQSRDGIRFLTNATTPVEVVRIDNLGDVGIGTSNPGALVNSNAIYFRPNPSAKFLDLYSDTNEADINLISNNSGDGSGIGGIYFTRARAQTDAHLQVAAIKAIQVGTGGTIAGGKLYFYTKVNAAGTAEALPQMVINADGNVGIGITNAAAKLHISGVGGTFMRLDAETLTSVAQFQAKASTDGVLIAGMYGPNPVAGTIFGANTSGAAFLGTTTLATVHPTLLAIGTSNTIPIIFGTNGIERMRLDSVGGISIGTSSQLNSSRVSIADPALKTSAGNCLTFGTATAGSNDFQLIITRGSNTDGYYALQSVEQGVGYKNIVFNQNGGNVGIGLTNPSTKLEVGYFLDAFTNKITVSCRYENQPEFNFKLGQAGTNFDWIGGVISCGDDGNYNGIINFKTANAGRDTPTTKMVIRANGNVGINITTPTSKLHVVETTPTGSRIQLGSISTSALMNANLVNDFLILTAPFNAVPASTSNNNAKWGIKMGGGSVDAPNALGKSACIYAVSEEDAVGGAGYNRKVGIALHTSPFDLPSVERFRITNIGDVGIGVTNPSNKLQISGGGISFTTSTGLAVPMIGILPTNIAYVGPYNSPADGNSPTLVLFNHARSVEQTWFYASGTIAMSLNRQGRFHIGDLNNAPNSLLSVGPSSSTTAVSGMCFGNDASANLYRSAASTIKTDGSLTVVGGASFGGNVGIGVTNPDLRLHIDASNAYPAAAGANTSGFLTLRAKTAGASHGMYMGVADASPWGSWIQCGDSVNSAVNYPLLLNPNGGNVGIGLRNPATSLDIAGSLRVTGIGQIGPAGGYGIALFNAGTNTFIGQSYGRASGIQFTDAAGLNTVYIANGGNVGIGVTIPLQKLHVVGAVYGTTYGQFGTAVANGTNASFAVFGSNSTSVGVKLVLDSDANRNDLVVAGTNGNVGIGRSDPAYKLDVNSTIVSRYTLSSPRFSSAGSYVYGVTNSPSWTTSLGSYTNNNVTAPDATATGGTYTFTATAGGFDLYQTISSLTVGRVYTIGMWVKLGTATNFCLVVNNTISWNSIGGKAFTSSDGLSTGKWTHISFTFTQPAGSNQINIHLGSHAETAVTQQTAGTVFLWNIEMTEFSSTWIGNVEDEIRLPGSSIWTSRGNVGIGTTNPSGRLSVDFVGSSAFNVCDSASSNVRVTVGTVNDAGTNYGLIQTYQHNTNTAGVSPLTIQPFGGNVGIGITNSSALFHVFSIAGRYINFTPASVSGLLVQRNQSIGSQGTTVLTLVNAQGAEATPERGTSLNLDIGYGGTSTTTAGTIARGARIAALNYNVYDATAASQNASLVFYTATGGSLTEATRITADGKVGIGITNPTAKLQVVQSNAAGVAAILLSSDESTIQGPSANTQIRMGSNLVLNGSNILTLGTNNVTRMVIDVTGNVGIGTVAPTAQNNYKFLQVNGTTAAIIEAMVNNVRIGGIDSDSSNLYFGSIGSFPIVFRTAVVEKMRITAAGLVGIGTATPTTLLSVGGAGSISAASGITFGGDSVANIYRSSASQLKTDGSFVVTNTLTVLGGDLGIRILKNGSDSISSNLYIANTANTRAYNFQPDAAGTNLALWTYNSANAWQNSVNFNYNGSVGIGTTAPSGKLHIVSTIAGETVLRTDGTNGTLFSVVDDLSDSLMSVNNSAGLPVLEVFADDRVVAGQYGSGDFVLINNKIGLGTSNPANKLTVIGGASIGSTTYNTAAPSNGLIVEGNVGIGATNPASKLTVVGDIGLYKNGGDTIVSCLYIANAANNRAFNFQLNADGTRFDLWSYNSANAWQNNVSFNYDGNVGINKTAPTTKLDVVGSFRVVGTTNVGGIFITGSQANQGNIRPAVSNGSVLISDDSGLSTRGLTVSNGGGAIISSTDANYDMLTLQIGGTTNHSFNKDGNVGIGATNPNSARLHIKGNGSVPVIRVETALIESPAGGTAGRTLRGWLPIMTGAAGTDKVYIPLFGPLN